MSKAPVWSLVFINPKMAELKNKTPLSEHNGLPAEERVLLPENYIVILAFRKKDRDEVLRQVAEGLKSAHAQLLER